MYHLAPPTFNCPCKDHNNRLLCIGEIFSRAGLKEARTAISSEFFFKSPEHYRDHCVFDQTTFFWFIWYSFLHCMNPRLIIRLNLNWIIHIRGICPGVDDYDIKENFMLYLTPDEAHQKKKIGGVLSELFLRAVAIVNSLTFFLYYADAERNTLISLFRIFFLDCFIIPSNAMRLKRTFFQNLFLSGITALENSDTLCIVRGINHAKLCMKALLTNSLLQRIDADETATFVIRFSLEPLFHFHAIILYVYGLKEMACMVCPHAIDYFTRSKFLFTAPIDVVSLRGLSGKHVLEIVKRRLFGAFFAQYCQYNMYGINPSFHYSYQLFVNSAKCLVNRTRCITREKNQKSYFTLTRAGNIACRPN